MVVVMYIMNICYQNTQWLVLAFSICLYICFIIIVMWLWLCSSSFAVFTVAASKQHQHLAICDFSIYDNIHIRVCIHRLLLYMYDQIWICLSFQHLWSRAHTKNYKHIYLPIDWLRNTCLLIQYRFMQSIWLAHAK